MSKRFSRACAALLTTLLMVSVPASMANATPSHGSVTVVYTSEDGANIPPATLTAHPGARVHVPIPDGYQQVGGPHSVQVSGTDTGVAVVIKPEASPKPAPPAPAQSGEKNEEKDSDDNVGLIFITGVGIICILLALVSI